MMFGNWKVQIIDVPGYELRRVYVFQRLNGSTAFLTKDSTVVTMQDNETQEYEDNYFADMSSDQLQAFADTLANKGVKTANDAKNEGLLVAKDAHLKDMRRLVFKGKK